MLQRANLHEFDPQLGDRITKLESAYRDQFENFGSLAEMVQTELQRIDHNQESFRQTLIREGEEKRMLWEKVHQLEQMIQIQSSECPAPFASAVHTPSPCEPLQCSSRHYAGQPGSRAATSTQPGAAMAVEPGLEAQLGQVAWKRLPAPDDMEGLGASGDEGQWEADGEGSGDSDCRSIPPPAAATRRSASATQRSPPSATLPSPSHHPPTRRPPDQGMQRRPLATPLTGDGWHVRTVGSPRESRVLRTPLHSSFGSVACDAAPTRRVPRLIPPVIFKGLHA